MKKLIYLENQHGAQPDKPYLFETDCEWPIQKLESLSWMHRGAGSVATDFDDFKTLLEAAGYTINLIGYGETAQRMWMKEGLGRVNGATGNL